MKFYRTKKGLHGKVIGYSRICTFYAVDGELFTEQEMKELRINRTMVDAIELSSDETAYIGNTRLQVSDTLVKEAQR